MGVESNLEVVRGRIDAACAAAQRDPSQVRLIAVSKGRPTDDIRAAYAAGQRDFGENRVQEAVAKAPLLPPDIEWHLLGPLQSNKVRKAVALFHVVHAIDRPAIAFELDQEAARQGRWDGAAEALDLPLLPDTWAAAIDVFEKSATVRRIFPEELIRNLVMTKRQELRYMDELSPEEQTEIYLDTV